MVGAVGADERGSGLPRPAPRPGASTSPRCASSTDAPPARPGSPSTTRARTPSSSSPGANAQVAADDLPDAAGPRAGRRAAASSSRCRCGPWPRPPRAAHGRGARVVLNAAPYAALPHDVAALADPLVVNEHEALQLADSDAAPTLAAGDLRRRGVQLGRGAVRRHTGGRRRTSSTRPVPATRSVGRWLRPWPRSRPRTRRSGQRARPARQRCGTAARSATRSSEPSAVRTQARRGCRV